MVGVSEDDDGAVLDLAHRGVLDARGREPVLPRGQGGAVRNGPSQMVEADARLVESSGRAHSVVDEADHGHGGRMQQRHSLEPGLVLLEEELEIEQLAVPQLAHLEVAHREGDVRETRQFRHHGQCIRPAPGHAVRMARQNDSVTDEDAAAPLTDSERAERLRELQALMELMRPAVQADGGDLRLVSVDVESGVVEVQLQGACSSCAISSVTLQGGVERILKGRLPWVTEVLGGVDDTVDPFESEAMGRGAYVPRGY